MSSLTLYNGDIPTIFSNNMKRFSGAETTYNCQEKAVCSRPRLYTVIVLVYEACCSVRVCKLRSAMEHLHVYITSSKANTRTRNWNVCQHLNIRY